jgi:NADH-quinone oxidoreductase subunit M
MIESWMTPWLLLAIPLLGAGLGLLMKASLQRMKTVALATTGVSLLAAIGTSLVQTEPAAAMALLCLLPATAFLSLLGQPLHRDNSSAWIMTLILLGVALGILTSHAVAHELLLTLLLGLVCGLLYRYQPGSAPATWRGMSSFGLGIISTVMALALPSPVSTIASLVTCATLLPLLPVHSGFVAALSGLPGSLPAFLGLLLPTVGFHTLCLLLPTLSTTALHTVALLALAGAVYGSLRALIQSHPLPRLGYASLAFFCMLWWYIADTGTAPVQTMVYLSAVGLTTSGLLMAWHAIRARYGDIDFRALGGLAYPMPRFSTLLALLGLAALGMPPFGVFSGFLGMFLTPAFAPSGPFAIIMLVWLTASWYYTDLIQQVVFGRPRLDVRHEDLRQTEFLSLLLVLLLLLILGTAPSRVFESRAAGPPAAVAMKGEPWTR